MFISIFSITDIDDCAEHPCKNGGTCQDKVAGYMCKCISGYTGTNCDTGSLFALSSFTYVNSLINTIL